LDGRRLLKKAGENFPEDAAVGFVINLGGKKPPFTEYYLLSFFLF
jgi:hypothetical protein